LISDILSKSFSGEGIILSNNNAKGVILKGVNKNEKNIVEFKIIKQLRQKETTKELWLAFSPIKSNYQNFMLQKATELGVTKFLPIIFDRKRKIRWFGINGKKYISYFQ